MSDAAGRAAPLSVVVPTLDEEDHLQGLFASLGWAPAQAARASWAPEEVIVVDGGSRDATGAIARAHGARLCSAARGRGTQLAAGAALARGELLLFLHADMRLAPGSLERLRTAFDDPALVAAGMRQRIEAPGAFYRCVERAANLRVRLGRIYGDSALAVRRSAYEKAGGFRDQPLFEDVDLAGRLRPLGRLALLAETEVRISARRWQAEGPLKRTLKNWILTAGYGLGVDPARLARYYRPQSENPEEEHA